METLKVVPVNVGLVILLSFLVKELPERPVGKPIEALGWFAQVNIFDGLIPVRMGARKPET